MNRSTPTEEHRDRIKGTLKDLHYQLCFVGDLNRNQKIKLVSVLLDMANHVYDNQIEKEHRDRQYQAAEDAMDVIYTDPDMW
ncbi:hypothetical protein BSP38_061 [Bacillus phage BSP38]|uniref:Uncharacterized protein n=1 Tax=Bacillus phage BSP38 TaxID=2283013 RepID=A0A345MJS1_BPBSP|nr:hypothetical protein HWB82_gp061 [Bacillus phage BSP38]AXH71103.1 hypothetical protein BSP38_061 [Bacillus phage BSP38]